MPLPAFIPEGVPHRAPATKIEVMEPVAVMRILAVALDIGKSPELTAHMVKYAV